MAKTYYAKIRIDGKGTPVPVKVMANDISQAKKIIQAQYGKVSFSQSPNPGSGGKAPSWFK
ncbi:MAG: hypothetical protein F4013_11785 [Gammaproteobacteria bacterium]|nr:hypothetical protein [Gammaproteobacteria bacterium]MYL02339.1 hypothetical protein [Gammaproteobacteria bacterium]